MLTMPIATSAISRPGPRHKVISAAGKSWAIGGFHLLARNRIALAECFCAGAMRNGDKPNASDRGCDTLGLVLIKFPFCVWLQLDGCAAAGHSRVRHVRAYFYILAEPNHAARQVVGEPFVSPRPSVVGDEVHFDVELLCRDDIG